MPVRHPLVTGALAELLFDDPLAGHCLVSPGGTIEDANDVWLRASGVTRERAVGSPIGDLTPGPDGDPTLHEQVRAGRRLDIPRHVRRVDGRETVWHGTVAPVAMEHGTGMLISIRDAAAPDADVHTSRSPTAHDTFRHLVEQSPFGVYVIDGEFRLIQVSAGAQKVFENVRPLLGRDFADVLRTVWSEPFATEAIGRFRRTLDTGEPFHSPSTVEHRQDVPVVESYDWKIERITLPDGRHGVVCHFYDLSERQRYETALHAKTQQIASLLTYAPIGLCFFDREHRYVQINDNLASINGIPAADHIGRTIEELLPVNARTVVPVIDQIFSTGEAVDSVEVTGQTPRDPGVQRHWLSGFYPVRDQDGAVVLVGGWVIEITARKRAEQELQQANQRKNDFLAVLSHELRNPLAPIRTGVYLLERAAPGSHQAARARDVIRRQADHLTRLVDDLLDLTRISRGKIELRRERLELGKLVHRTLEDLRSGFEQGEVMLRAETTSEPLWVDGDATRLSQVLGNLLQNSLKFTPPGGEVTVRLTSHAGLAHLSVADSGVGIEPGRVEQMFEPFAQGDTALARTPGGLGLGLSLVRGLVEIHGGLVQARSDGPGLGTEFTVSLPIAGPGETHQSRPENTSAREPRTIVLVEDSRDAALVLRDMLEMCGHSVHVAHDATTGLRLVAEIGPDIVLCDLGLPDLDGFEVARRIRGELGLRSTRLIALSGYAQEHDRRLARDAGFDRHLAKPPDPEELLNALADEMPQ